MSTVPSTTALSPTVNNVLPLKTNLAARGRWARGPIGHPPGLALEVDAKVHVADDGSRVASSDTRSGADPDRSDTDEDLASEPWSVGPFDHPPGLGLEVGAVAFASLPLKVRLPDDGSHFAGGDSCSKDLAPEPWPVALVAPPPGLGPGEGAVVPAEVTPLRSQAIPAGVTPLRGQAAAFSPLRSRAEAFVPRCLALAGGRHPRPGGDGPKAHKWTTVMMRNVPLSYTCDSLIDLLDSNGFSAWFDFVYVPIKRTEVLGVGYAFVNLVTPQRAEEFMLAFEGFDSWASSASEAACSVKWSVCQGLSENISRYRNSPFMTDDVPAFYKPVLLKDGVRIAFPKPTKPLRVMRRRKIKGQEGED